MPIYTFTCDKCERAQEVIRSAANRDDEVVCKCGRLMKRAFDTPGLVWAPTSGGYR